MLSRRNYFVILMLFLTAFVLFISVNVTTGMLANNTVSSINYEKSPQMLQIAVKAGDLELDAADFAAGAENTGAAQTDGAAQTGSMLPETAVAIVVPDADSAYAHWAKEWCLYQKYRYAVFDRMPSAEEIAPFGIVVFGDVELDGSSLDALRGMAAGKRDMIFMKLPSYSAMAADRDLADFFGIARCMQPDYALDGVHILKDFFISDERIYNAEAFYDESDSVRYQVDYYMLRSGYQVYIQGIPEDASVMYYDYPALLWRSYTGNANIYAVNTDLFNSKSMIGVLTAFVSQSAGYYVYPVVDAQSFSVLDYPLLSPENNDQIKGIYSRDSVALNRDILWPAIDKILLSYDGSYNFFMAPQLDYSDDTQPRSDLVDFYRGEINKRMGVLGVSMNQISDVSLAQKMREDRQFLDVAMPGTTFSAAYVGRADLADFAAAVNSEGNFNDVAVVMTDYSETEKIIEITDDGVLQVSFTDNGYYHTALDDLNLICLETALGMNNQQVSMQKLVYPDDPGVTWNSYSVAWARGDTYLRNFRKFADTTVYELGDKAANFLSVRYRTEQTDSGLRLHIESRNDQTSFILRLNASKIADVQGAEYEALTDSAYLLRCNGSTVDITLKDVYGVNDIPDRTVEVKR